MLNFPHCEKETKFNLWKKPFKWWFSMNFQAWYPWYKNLQFAQSILWPLKSFLVLKMNKKTSVYCIEKSQFKETRLSFSLVPSLELEWYIVAKSFSFWKLLWGKKVIFAQKSVDFEEFSRWPLRFYVKSILGILWVQSLPFLHI